MVGAVRFRRRFFSNAETRSEADGRSLGTKDPEGRGLARLSCGQATVVLPPRRYSAVLFLESAPLGEFRDMTR